MRKQYHFRQKGKDTWIWDIDRLVSLTRKYETIEFPLKKIRELDEAFWYGFPSDVPTCRSVAEHAKLIHESSLEHPIILSPEGRVMDGMHRVCKAYISGMITIKARKFDILPEPDYINVPADVLPLM